MNLRMSFDCATARQRSSSSASFALGAVTRIRSRRSMAVRRSMRCEGIISGRLNIVAAYHRGELLQIRQLAFLPCSRIKAEGALNAIPIRTHGLQIECAGLATVA